jgi:hypothetical protein
MTVDTYVGHGTKIQSITFDDFNQQDQHQSTRGSWWRGLRMTGQTSRISLAKCIFGGSLTFEEVFLHIQDSLHEQGRRPQQGSWSRWSTSVLPTRSLRLGRVALTRPSAAVSVLPLRLCQIRKKKQLPSGSALSSSFFSVYTYFNVSWFDLHLVIND